MATDAYRLWYASGKIAAEYVVDTDGEYVGAYKAWQEDGREADDDIDDIRETCCFRTRLIFQIVRTNKKGADCAFFLFNCTNCMIAILVFTKYLIHKTRDLLNTRSKPT